MSNTVAKPRNTLDIKHVRVCDAYFAKRIDEPEHEETQEEYIVKSGDTLSKIAKAKATTVSDLKKDNKLTSDVIQLGQKLTVNTQVEKGNKVTFEQLYNANLGDEVYVVVTTSNFENKKVWLNVRQGDEEGLVEANCAVQLLVNDQEVFRPEAVVGAYANDTKITNGADFKDWAIFKFKLGGKDTKAYADALEKLTNKKTKLCIIIDAHNPNSIPSNHVGYEGYDGKLDHSEEPNCWLDSDGKWFELNGNKRSPWMEIALKEAKKAKGVKEGSRPLYAMVEKYHNHVGLVDDPKTDKKEDDPTSVAWCASFVSWCLNQTDYIGLKTTGSRFYLADDPKWNKKSKNFFTKIEKPVYGAITVFSDCNSKGVSRSTGHVAFLYGKLKGEKMVVLGGNQGNKIKITSYDCSGNTFVSYTDKKGNKHYKKFRGYYLPKEYLVSDLDSLNSKDTYNSSKEANKEATGKEININKKGESSR